MRPGRRVFLYGALGALGGLLTYTLSLPLFPHKTLAEMLGPASSNPADLEKLLTQVQNLPPLTTLGTPYGNLAYFLLGGFVTSFLVLFLRFERQGLLKALLFAALSFVAGGFVTRWADAFSDTLLVYMPGGRYLGVLPWGFLVGGTISLVIWIFQGPTLPRFKRALIAGLSAGVVSFCVRLLVAPMIAISSVATIFKGGMPDANSLMQLDMWEAAKPDFLANYVIMSAAIGVCFAFIEARLRRASIRWEVGRKEGKEWELGLHPIVIGASERATIRLPEDGSIAPEHAVLGVYGVNYAVQPQPGHAIFVNGYLAPAAYLRHGDVITVGSYNLRFLEANMPKLRPIAAPIPMAVTERTTPPPVPVSAPVAPALPSIQAWVEHIDGRTTTIGIGETIVGRNADLPIVIATTAASRQHAVFVNDGKSVLLRDLGSTNGTFVAGQRITEVVLNSGDLIDIGGTGLVFRMK